MENTEIREYTALELVQKFGPDCKFRVVDISEAVRVVSGIQQEIEILEFRARNAQPGEIAVMQHYYEETQNLESDTNGTLSVKTPRSGEEAKVSCEEMEEAFDPAVVRESDFPSSSSMGDDDVFYDGNGTEDQPIEIV